MDYYDEEMKDGAQQDEGFKILTVKFTPAKIQQTATLTNRRSSTS
jgi:hypothetical protein